MVKGAAPQPPTEIHETDENGSMILKQTKGLLTHAWRLDSLSCPSETSSSSNIIITYDARGCCSSKFPESYWRFHH